MSAYVDEPRYRLGRMWMCHLLADSTDELLAMADRIGVSRRWIQAAGTAREHFDICKAKRALAVQAGAFEVSSRHLAELIAGRRAVA